MHDNSLPTTSDAPRGLKLGALLLVGVAGVTIAVGLVSRSHEATSAQTWANQQAVPSVHLIVPKPAGTSNELVLPGNTLAWDTAHIYARVSGYVRAWYKDIGATVGNGTPLGAVDTPELDQEINEARANLVQVKAEAALAKTTAARWNDLLATNSVSHQEADEKNANLASQNAAVGKAEASLGRLLAMKSYATVRAPFAGVVTQRNADIGDLVGPGATNAQPMFSLADESRMRVYVQVPQNYAAQMQKGLTATLDVPGYPGKTFTARLTDQANAVNSQTGSMQVQLVTENPGLLLKAGGYAQVHFKLPVPGGRMSVPDSALILRGGGTHVGTVDANGHVHLIPVIVGHDDGTNVEVSAGLTPGTPIIDNPPDSIIEGEQVHVEGNHG